MEQLKKCEELVKDIYNNMDASHDFQHIERVYENALTILKTEPTANEKIVRLAVLLHDVSDSKYASDKSNEDRILKELQLSAEETTQNKEREILYRSHFPLVVEDVAWQSQASHLECNRRSA